MPTNTPNVKNKKHVAHLEQVRRQNQVIKIGAIVIIVVVLALVSYGFFLDPIIKRSRPVAIVNGDNITVGRFQVEGKIERLQLVNQYSQYLQYAQMFGITDLSNDQNFGPAVQQIQQKLMDSQTLGREILDAVIDDALIRQEAKRRNITVSADEVEKEVQAGVGYYPNGAPTATNTSAPIVTPTLNATQYALVSATPTQGTVTPTITPTLDPSITPGTPTITITPTITVTPGPSSTPLPTSTALPTSTQVNEEGYKTLLKEQLDGLNNQAKLSESDLRTVHESAIYRRKVQEAVLGDLQPEQEQVWARHILVATEEEAKAILERLKKGEDFGAIAKEKSTDTGSGANGGDLGWFAKGAMVAEFETSAFSLKIGEISQPIQTSYGYHIIQVLGHEKRQLDETAFQTFKDQSFADFLKKLRESSTVQEFDLWKEVVPTEPSLPTVQQ